MGRSFFRVNHCTLVLPTTPEPLESKPCTRISRLLLISTQWPTSTWAGNGVCLDFWEQWDFSTTGECVERHPNNLVDCGSTFRIPHGGYSHSPGANVKGSLSQDR